MISVLAIGLDYLMLQKSKVRGDVCSRQLEYAKHLHSFDMVIFSPLKLGLKHQNWADNLAIHPTNSINKAAFIIDAYRIASGICRKKKIDVITSEDPFTAGVVGVLLRKRFGIPLNVQAHNDFCDNKYWLALRRINFLFNSLGKSVLKRADTVRIGTEYEKSKISQKLNIHSSRLNVIPVNADLDKFSGVSGEAVRSKYCVNGIAKILLFSGRLVGQKDIPTLLKSFRIVYSQRKDTCLLILGSGPLEEELKQLAKNTGIQDRVFFTGAVPHEKIPQYLAACDVYTISSVFEGTCIAMAEAMASAKPVVVTRFAGADDLVKDGYNGFKVEQKDCRSFAEKVLFLLDNPSDARRMGRASRDAVMDKFSGNKNIDLIIRLWEKTAGINSRESQYESNTCRNSRT